MGPGFSKDVGIKLWRNGASFVKDCADYDGVILMRLLVLSFSNNGQIYTKYIITQHKEEIFSKEIFTIIETKKKKRRMINALIFFFYFFFRLMFRDRYKCVGEDIERNNKSCSNHLRNH